MRKLFYTATVSIFILLNGPHVLAQFSDCPPDGEAQHWDKIVFKVKLGKKQDPVIPPEFLNVNLDLKITDPPRFVANLDQEVRAALAEEFDLSEFDEDLLKIDIIDVKYQIVTCALGGGSQGPQGVPGPAGSPGPAGAATVQVIGVPGAQGIPGPQGPPGADGADGAQGAVGSIDLSKIVHIIAISPAVTGNVLCPSPIHRVLGGGVSCFPGSVLSTSEAFFPPSDNDQFPTESWQGVCVDAIGNDEFPQRTQVICVGP